MLMANSAAILTDAFPAGQRGMALGINQIAGISGQFVGLLLGGVLAAWDWRAASRGVIGCASRPVTEPQSPARSWFRDFLRIQSLANMAGGSMVQMAVPTMAVVHSQRTSIRS